MPSLVHATCVSVDGRGALIVGPSGAGKSDLALRVVMSPFQDDGRSITANLVADDQVLLETRAGRLLASPPVTITGRLEVRGLGIIDMPFVQSCEVCLIVDIASGRPVERLPDPTERRDIAGFRLPVLRLDAREASAPAKLVLALLRLDREWAQTGERGLDAALSRLRQARLTIYAGLELAYAADSARKRIVVER